MGGLLFGFPIMIVGLIVIQRSLVQFEDGKRVLGFIDLLIGLPISGFGIWVMTLGGSH